MKEMTCIVIGGGYAGINAIKNIQKSLKKRGDIARLKLVLIDKNPYHLRKVLLFKPAARNHEITLPLNRLFPEGVEIVQGTVTKVNPKEKNILYQDSKSMNKTMNYDLLVVAVGSVMKQPDPFQGGISLSSLDDAVKIRAIWKANLEKALSESKEKERRKLMTIAVAGAGLSGIETAAELSHSVREEAKKMGLDSDAVRIYLYNSKARLFPNGPEKVGRMLEDKLVKYDVTVIHGTKVRKENDGILSLSNEKEISVGLCIWTMGLVPNPMLNHIGLPITSDGHLIVDESYRVQGTHNIYSIGDCARIMDPLTGLEDGMTCKEANAQAIRLAKILSADLDGRPALKHKRFDDFFCFALGPNDGMAWLGKWGLNFILTGKLGWKIREWTWNSASMVQK